MAFSGFGFSRQAYTMLLMKELSMAQINQLSQAGFINTFKDIFEHSSWVAEAAFEQRPFEDVAALHQAMVDAVAKADMAQQLGLIRAHPDLAGKAARIGELTTASRREQSGAGLDQLSEAEFARFHNLNSSYKARFDFPFILAVKGHTKESILAAFETRLGHSITEEHQTALEQIYQIAWYRLDALVEV